MTTDPTPERRSDEPEFDPSATADAHNGRDAGIGESGSDSAPGHEGADHYSTLGMLVRAGRDAAAEMFLMSDPVAAGYGAAWLLMHRFGPHLASVPSVESLPLLCQWADLMIGSSIPSLHASRITHIEVGTADVGFAGPGGALDTTSCGILELPVGHPGKRTVTLGVCVIEDDAVPIPAELRFITAVRVTTGTARPAVAAVAVGLATLWFAPELRRLTASRRCSDRRSTLEDKMGRFGIDVEFTPGSEQAADLDTVDSSDRGRNSLEAVVQTVAVTLLAVAHNLKIVESHDGVPPPSLSERWSEVVADGLRIRHDGKPELQQRSVEHSRAMFRSFDEESLITWPRPDGEIVDSYVDAPVRVNSRNGSEPELQPPADGTRRSRRWGIREAYSTAEEAGALIPSPIIPPEEIEPNDIPTVLTRWDPYGWTDHEREILARIRKTAEACVVQAAPSDADQARVSMRYNASYLVFLWSTLGISDPKDAYTQHNADIWLRSLRSTRNDSWCYQARRMVERVGRAVNPEGWTKKPIQLKRPGDPMPYDEAEQAMFARSLRHVVRADLAQRIWVGAGALGCGLRGTEMEAARAEDVEEVTGGLLVHVRGANARCVPVLHRYTDLVLDAMESVGDGPFIDAKRPSAAAGIAAGIRVGDESLSLSRARATWLTTHLRGGTALDVLRVIAGPVSANKLTGLIERAAARLDSLEAAMRALGL